MIIFFRQSIGSAEAMSSVWSEQWPLAGSNNTPDSNSCFNATHSTVLNGDQFGGIPLVLLLNFCVFVVGLSSCTNMTPLNVCHSDKLNCVAI